ncbi:MAG: hypothetical protein QF632_04325 [Candidatus Woesearchaeota archaeon]|jgi:hypothetical protein|nr:hypothetical protein [Candidatus Woesearchaeota archaeon]|tara:strand:- start:356 stop:664 length:309 start_codon:yes stop_codon:yes gene_type:complete
MLDEKTQEMMRELEYGVPLTFGPRTQLEIPGQGQLIQKIYGGHGASVQPVLDYMRFKHNVIDNPSPENVGKLQDLHNSFGLSGAEQEDFLTKLKQYAGEIDR